MTDFHVQGPDLLHFRHTSLKDLEEKIAKAWEQVLHENITLPTPYIKLYDKEGQLTGYKYFHNLDHEPMDTTTPSAEQNDTRVDNTLTDDSSASSRAVEKRDDSGPSAVDEETVSIQTTTDYCEDIITVNKENEAEPPVPSYKTKLCTAVHRLLGSAGIAGPIQHQLLELDTLRHFIRMNKRPPQRSIANYEHLLAAVSEHVTARCTVLKRTVKDFENNYYRFHQMLPDLHLNSDYRDLVKSYKSVRKLLEMWSKTA